jgi:hypothetical protein
MTPTVWAQPEEMTRWCSDADLCAASRGLLGTGTMLVVVADMVIPKYVKE